MKKLISLSLLLLWLGSLSAQSFVGKLNFHPQSSQKLLSSSDTVKILAVMVEFKKYKDPNTSGDGTFGSMYTQAYGDTILDPLPFDVKYFSSHLDFAKNYFTKVSNGKLNVTYTILPQVITVSDTMRKYSPSPQNASDQTNLGKFAKEVWQIAGATYPDLDFSKYNLFTVFHAGVGKEFSPPGSLGNERDIPSVYLGLNSLKNIFGNSFNGFSVNGGNFLIDNTMILPSTESREISTVGGDVLVQLTINGLIVSSIASHLGLPDLFNTLTGTTAISRFGLMDGSSIFAYSGLFPPEPSAWEKIYLGWAQPITVSIADAKINIATRRTAALSDTTILKVPINSTEYYLIENRQRDANKDGLKLTYNLRGQSYTFSLDKDKGRFQWYGVDTVKGVVTDVDDFDWAAPGNGIVIWHIDENIINNTIAVDKINADLDHRGIYVEEADGIFDIGQKYVSILGDVVYGDGYQVDMWYAGNEGKYFKNKFGPDTKPNTTTNSGANSLITMQNFSAPANKMSFDISFGKSDVKLISSTKLNLGKLNTYLTASSSAIGSTILVVDNGDLKEYSLDGKPMKNIPNFSFIKPVVFYVNSDEYKLGALRKSMNIYSTVSGTDFLQSIIFPDTITALAVDKNDLGNPKIFIGTINGSAYAVPLNDLKSMSQFPSDTYSIYKGNTQIINFGIEGNFYTVLEPNNIIEHLSQSFQTPINSVSSKSIFSKDIAGVHQSIILSSGNDFVNFRIISQGQTISSFQIQRNPSSLTIGNLFGNDALYKSQISTKYYNSFSVADLFNDGQNYILFSNGSHLDAYNFEGVMANNFPFIEPNGANFIGTPLVLDMNNDGNVEIIAFTETGNIYAINATTGKVVDGFPISTGAKSATSPIIISEPLPASMFKPYLAVLDSTGQLYVWNLSATHGKVYWAGENGDALNTSFVGAPSSTNQITEFFPTDKAYNYPNPVYNGETQIRYYVSENANVQIKIFDLGGGLVADISDHANGGFDNETTWNVNKVQSGVYYAHIQVNGESGKSASKIIKIAVIK